VADFPVSLGLLLQLCVLEFFYTPVMKKMCLNIRTVVPKRPLLLTLRAQRFSDQQCTN
jgi:hypothetical protein